MAGDGDRLDRRGASCILDLVAREEPVREWRRLADQYDASVAVIECICSDIDVHRSRVHGRQRRIPGWYELDWDHVQRSRQLYAPISAPKVVIDAVVGIDRNLDEVRAHLAQQHRSAAR